MAISGERAWKNTRKRSLYVEEGYAGFIFYRKSKAPRDREVQPASPPTAVDAAAHHISVEDEDETEPLLEDKLEKLVEVKGFVEHLRRAVVANRVGITDEKLEEACGKVYEELRRSVISGSGLYIQCLEACEDEDKLPPHPMDTQLTESIRQLQQKIDMCEREVREWDTLIENKKAAAQSTSQDLTSNLSVDWSQLGPEDEAKLTSHLSPEQCDWLRRATSERDDEKWKERIEERIKTVKSRIDCELERVKTYCDGVLQECAIQTSKLGTGDSLPTQTPRTLFRALKDTN